MDFAWQRKCSFIKDRRVHLLKNGYLSDCSFAVGKKEQIFQAHKLILAEASPIFESMFFGKIAKLTDKPIQVEDMQPDIFALMLKYIYTDKIQLKSCRNAIHLIYIARKYMLNYLLKCCKDYLSKKLSPLNALEVYKLGELYEEHELVKMALKVICENTRIILNSPKFHNIDVTLMTTIIEQNNLEVKEIELFKSLESLAKAHGIIETTEEIQFNKNFPVEISKKRNNWENFRNAVKKIEYLSMTVNEFANGPGFSKLLLPGEVVGILACLNNPANIEYRYPVGFEKSRRQHLSIEINYPTTILQTVILKKRSQSAVMALKSDIFPEITAYIQNKFTRTVYNDSTYYRITKHCAIIRLDCTDSHFTELNVSLTYEAGTIAIGNMNGEIVLQITLVDNVTFIPGSIVIGKVISGLYEVFNTSGCWLSFK